MLKAGVAVAGALGGGGIDLIQIAKHCLDRCVQAVKIKTVETYFGSVCGQRRVVVAQPFNEVDHHCVAPHPRRKPFESAECFVGASVITQTPDITVNSESIRPIRFNRDRREVLLFY